MNQEPTIMSKAVFAVSKRHFLVAFCIPVSFLHDGSTPRITMADDGLGSSGAKNGIDPFRAVGDVDGHCDKFNWIAVFTDDVNIEVQLRDRSCNQHALTVGIMLKQSPVEDGMKDIAGAQAFFMRFSQCVI